MTRHVLCDFSKASFGSWLASNLRLILAKKTGHFEWPSDFVGRVLFGRRPAPRWTWQVHWKKGLGWNQTKRPRDRQGCQMVYFQTKNPNLGKFWRALDWKLLLFYGHLEQFTVIWDIFWPFGTFCVHLVHFSGFGIMYHEKSGNSGSTDSISVT
jgi:hypothetical protein